VVEAGGEVLQAKQYMGEMVGWTAYFRDTEGNRLGFEFMEPPQLSQYLRAAILIQGLENSHEHNLRECYGAAEKRPGYRGNGLQSHLPHPSRRGDAGQKAVE